MSEPQDDIEDIGMEIARLSRLISPIQSDVTKEALRSILKILCKMDDALTSLDGYVEAEDEEAE